MSTFSNKRLQFLKCDKNLMYYPFYCFNSNKIHKVDCREIYHNFPPTMHYFYLG